MVNFNLIFLLLMSLLPSLVYLMLYRKLKQQWENRLEQVRWVININHRENFSDSYLPEAESELVFYCLGDPSCIYNARSPYIRCAVNPCGSCENCPHYQSI